MGVTSTVAEAIGWLERGELGRDPIAAELRSWLRRRPAPITDPRWSAHYAPSPWSEPFLDRIAAVTLARDGGVAFGLFVVAAGTFYPEHGHDARELYLTLAGDPLFLHGDEWLDLGRGRASIQEPGEIHALRTRSEAATFFWAWTGDLESPIWALDGDGHCFYPPAA